MRTPTPPSHSKLFFWGRREPAWVARPTSCSLVGQVGNLRRVVNPPRRTRQTAFRNCRGQALVEFAMTAVTLLVLLFFLFEFGRILLVYETVSNAARVGTRYAIVHGSDNLASTTDIQTYVQNFLSAGSAGSAGATITPSWPDTGSCKNPGCRVKITVSYAYDPMLPFVPISTFSISSSSEGVITW